MTQITRVLIAIDWYRPAHKAGGPITSIENLINLLGNEPHLQFYIVCSCLDYGQPNPLQVPQQTWVTEGKAQVQYWHPKKLGWREWLNIYNDLQPHIIHMQGIWSPRFSILPLMVAHWYKRARIVVSPRGMLTLQALKQNRIPKALVAVVLKTFGLYKNVLFHSTNDQETQEIQQFIKQPIQLQMPNVPRNLGEMMSQVSAQPPKSKGTLRWLFIGRLSPEKNPLLILEALKELSMPTEGYFIGGSNNENYLQQFNNQLQALPTHHKVTYLGEMLLEDMIEYLGWTHVLINASISENFGHAMAEALSAGVPIVVGPNTPWQHLWEEKAGCVVPYTALGFVEAMKKLGDMDGSEFAEFQAGAVNHFLIQCAITETKAKYLQLYSL